MRTEKRTQLSQDRGRHERVTETKTSHVKLVCRRVFVRRCYISRCFHQLLVTKSFLSAGEQDIFLSSIIFFDLYLSVREEKAKSSNRGHVGKALRKFPVNFHSLKVHCTPTPTHAEHGRDGAGHKKFCFAPWNKIKTAKFGCQFHSGGVHVIRPRLTRSCSP